MIYLDNASTTHHKPLSVKLATLKGVSRFSVNASRGGYDLSIKGGLQVLKVRQNMAKHFNAKTENVIFTSSCTTAINLALRGTVKKGGHIITTAMEHNSTLRTLEDLRRKGLIEYTIIEPKGDQIDPKDIENAIKSNTYLVSCIHVSNVTGNQNDIEKIGKLCKKHHLLFFTDCAQSAGHKRIDIKKLHINLLTFAGHKGFYAPQGIGGLIYEGVELSPIFTGGTGTFSESIVQPNDSPEGFESGTQSMPCILGLGAGLKYVENHFDKLNRRIETLTQYLLGKLKELPQYVVYSQNEKNGVVSFNHKDYSSSEMGEMLNKHHICVRTGLHCAPLVHKTHDTLQKGMVRVSIGGFNKMHDVKVLISVLRGIK